MDLAKLITIISKISLGICLICNCISTNILLNSYVTFNTQKTNKNSIKHN